MEEQVMRLLLIFLSLLALNACSIDDSALKVGMKAPSLQTKTLADVGGDFSRITTYRYPDKRMYQVSLDEALQADKPIVLEFATPGHCTVCDKQLQMLKGLLAKYEDDVIFLHMDQYQNPQAFKAFGVIGDPWTYVIDGSQTVRFKQAGRMLYGELDMIISGVLKTTKVAEAG
jgi:thiol-disulfide isomerase/thioredoxin